METQNDTVSTESPSTSGGSRFEELQRMVAGMEADFKKFYGDGNKAAGTRVRNAMQELKTFAQNVRTEVTTLKNAPAGSEKA